MNLFDRCRDFQSKIEYLKTHNQFFYLREFDPAATPVVTQKGKEYIMLGSNNYLGLVDHPKVIEATRKALENFGTGACSSRVLTGTTSLHTKLEKRLARFKGTQDSVVFSTGFMTMMGTISAITGEDDLIFSDELNHASIVEGCRLSKAKKQIYRHNDMGHLEEQLASTPSEKSKMIVTDGVFSMKGTVANIPAIKELADRYGAAVMVDDAHGTGVLGEKGHGTLEHYDLEGKIDLVCGTFSKSLCTIGGFTGSNSEVVTFLKLNSRSFIFTASPPPFVAATVLACLDVIDNEPEILRRLRDNTEFVKTKLKDYGFVLEDTITPIIPIMINDDEKTFRMAGALEEAGVIINPVVYPAVPPGASLIRVSVMASLSTEQLSEALDKMKAVGKKLQII
ncbi:MAG: aminotransferase class I/II-fold pyridoxal phosphate-dependent enzyme [candidate division WOR-3 bacterium]|nr:MAG: aminotransferase class I/II-fold pyridoxal phosphate-dependent enzyme [candidate division WOR-3 bacterium]